MAITFLQQRKKQQFLIYIMLIVIFLIFIVVWQGFFIQQPQVKVSPTPPRKIKLKWEILKAPQLTEFEPFEEILPLEEKPGRENPFLPY